MTGFLAIELASQPWPPAGLMEQQDHLVSAFLVSWCPMQRYSLSMRITGADALFSAGSVEHIIWMEKRFWCFWEASTHMPSSGGSTNSDSIRGLLLTDGWTGFHSWSFGLDLAREAWSSSVNVSLPVRKCRKSISKGDRVMMLIREAGAHPVSRLTKYIRFWEASWTW